MSLTATDILRVSCRYKSTVYGDAVQVFHLKIIAGTAVDEANVMTDIRAWINNWNTNIYAAQVASLDPYELRVDLVEVTNGKETVIRNIASETWTLTNVPDAGGEGLPSMDAAIVNFRTAIPKVFGRKYIPGLSETHQANGTIIAGIVTSLAAYAADVIADYVGTYTTLKAGVISLKSSEAAGFFAPFVGYVVNSILGTQRRRRINRGS